MVISSRKFSRSINLQFLFGKGRRIVPSAQNRVRGYSKITYSGAKIKRKHTRTQINNYFRMSPLMIFIACGRTKTHALT